VLPVSPVRVCEWLVTSVESSVVLEPYEVVVPYWTCELAGLFVVHEIVAPALLIPPDVTPLIVVGGGGAGGVTEKTTSTQ
jgi:hypothetical protein